MTIGRACVLVRSEQRERETRKKCAGRVRACGSVAGGRWRLSSEDPVDAAAARDRETNVILGSRSLTHGKRPFA